MELTPAMKQYMQIKNKYKDCIVFYRMGDFYETFYDDAKTTAEALDIALTKRGIRNSDQCIPLAGIPYHALDSYLHKMIKQGFKVAIVEQLEDPKLAKGVVKRDVVRVVTPGTIMDQNDHGNNYIASLCNGYGLSFVDLTTGEFYTTELSDLNEVITEITRYNPREILIPLSMEGSKLIKQLENYYLSFVSDVDYYIDNAKSNLKRHFNVLTLEAFGLKDKTYAISASGALISYLIETQKTSLTHINSISYLKKSEYVSLDSTTIKNLELVYNLKDRTKKGSLLDVLDETLTPMGMRLIRQIVLKPLVNVAKINERLLAVEELTVKHFLLQEIRELLKKISDIERLITRINYGNSNPRDLIMLQGSLELVPEIKFILTDAESVLLERLSDFSDLKHITSLIDIAIVDDPPAHLDEGNFIKKGYDKELDELRNIRSNAKKHIQKIESEEREKTGIKSLKIKYNKVFGYYIDVTKPNLHLVPPNYIKKQTLVNSERFITEELKNLEEKILTAEERIIKIERDIYKQIISEISKDTVKIQKIAQNLAYIDLLCSYAIVAINNNYSKPNINTNYNIKLKKSRHPVVEGFTSFISNDIEMTRNNNVMIITGPNMAGKSVLMRQVALIVIMAQIGSFVPAEYADIGIVDKIFCRTGASDDISQGQSTFMVEMSETAFILRNATEQSLIILDEIGRGTSTYDGVAIAWAVADYIARNIKAKTLFSTHYHVLNDLHKQLPTVKNYNIAVQEKDDKIIFLRKLVQGGTDKSYGIHVAKLAGMPDAVIKKSKEIQFKLEKDDEITEKIIVETRKSEQKDIINEEIETVDRLIKSRQMTLDEV